MTPRPRVRATTPSFVVADLQRSVDFYCRALGFIEPTLYGEPPCFAMLNRDGFDLMLTLAGPASSARPNGRDGIWDLYLAITDVTAELEALRAAGVTPVSGPRDTFYGMREIDVDDPDGHRICLAQDLSAEPWQVAQVWEGRLTIGGAPLRLMLKVAPSAGGLAARLDSLDQNAFDLPIDVIQRDGQRMTFAMTAISARFEGTVSDDDMTVDGTWTQRGASFPLAFRRVTGADPDRP